ncbi:MAG: DUF3562 domain-containing protein [Desulfobacterota bacterium]|nr:DUF3562 domain-containing protein [Thermodesulfobacteriota bacterium]
MTAETLYEDDLEKKQHLDAMQSLARDLKGVPEEVFQIYEAVLREYKKKARIKLYLSILVSKRVKELLDKGAFLS